MEERKHSLQEIRRSTPPGLRHTSIPRAVRLRMSNLSRGVRDRKVRFRTRIGYQISLRSYDGFRLLVTLVIEVRLLVISSRLDIAAMLCFLGLRMLTM